MNPLKTVKKIPIAKQGIFRTIQGEGVLIGTPMIFIRIGGCSVGCSECDTDYSIVERLHALELSMILSSLSIEPTDWAWITGGEPTDHDLSEFIDVIRSFGCRVALATAGTKKVQIGRAWGGVDFLSVSPHFLGDRWVQRSGDQLNLVPGLNGLAMNDIVMANERGEFKGFIHKFITPMYGEQVEESLNFVSKNQGWRLGIQAHKVWNLP